MGLLPGSVFPGRSSCEIIPLLRRELRSTSFIHVMQIDSTFEIACQFAGEFLHAITRLKEFSTHRNEMGDSQLDHFDA